MVDAVTYSLQDEAHHSEGYYASVGVFAGEVIGRGEVLLGSAVDDFIAYVQSYRLEAPRHREEYLFELLSFGILWNSYGGYAQSVRFAPFITLARMAEWRKKHQDFKPAIDRLRGMLITLFLYPRRGADTPALLPSLRDADRLCMWLEATGEFREQALRFVRWRAFWDTIPVARRSETSAALFAYADWFTVRSTEVLGDHTAHVDEFLTHSKSHYRWREDRVQCTRSRVEYHLNMVGAEIMNRAFGEDYRSTERKAVLLPGCMRSRPDDLCEGKRVPEGIVCSGCEPHCRVHQMREMGTKQNFEVFIIPHASDLSYWSPTPGHPRRGVVAAACVTTLVEGGWELKRYDVPAQCVLLDYSGCGKHWRPGDGVPTALNMREMKRRIVTKN